jgi:hypothetical protein
MVALAAVREIKPYGAFVCRLGRGKPIPCRQTVERRQKIGFPAMVHMISTEKLRGFFVFGRLIPSRFQKEIRILDMLRSGNYKERAGKPSPLGLG